MPDLDTDTARLIAALAETNAQIAELNTRAEAIKAELRAALPPGDHNLDGRPALRIIPTRRFDAGAGLQLIPTERRPECIKIEPDAGKIKALLTPEQVEGLMVTAGKPKVVLLP